MSQILNLIQISADFIEIVLIIIAIAKTTEKIDLSDGFDDSDKQALRDLLDRVKRDK